MSKETSNIGVVGPDSIRIGGMIPDDLPIAESAAIREQMPLVKKNDLQFQIDSIKASYPDQSSDVIRARIRECKNNKATFKTQRDLIEQKRSEYESLVAVCTIRDKEIGAIPESVPERDALVKAIGVRFGPWNVNAMETQIGQFTESMKRFDDAIKQEAASIQELRDVLVRIEIRGAELKKLGA